MSLIQEIQDFVNENEITEWKDFNNTNFRWMADQCIAFGQTYDLALSLDVKKHSGIADCIVDLFDGDDEDAQGYLADEVCRAIRREALNAVEMMFLSEDIKYYSTDPTQEEEDRLANPRGE